MRNNERKVLSGCQRGFTLIELMVVMIILGLLAALVVPKMFGKLETAKTNATYAQIELFGTALDSYRLDVGKYPSTGEGHEALISEVSGAEEWERSHI